MNNGDRPANPQAVGVTPSGDIYTSDDMGGAGLTKRETFAAMALQGLLANPGTYNGSSNINYAVNAADELLKALEETK